MTPRTGTVDRYAEEMGELWTKLGWTLRRLDRFASDPELVEDADSLRRLQYSLHLASEHAYGVEPPERSATAHAELADALVCARDATAEVADALDADGADGVHALVHEWRGALFRVRLARLRLAASPKRVLIAELPADEGIARPLAAFVLALVGALAFVTGATLGSWPVWVLGLGAVCASVVAYRP